MRCSSVSTMAGSGMQASTGQTLAQDSLSSKPTHSVQRVGSMTKMSSPAELAPFGHSGSQAVQLMQASVMTVAIARVDLTEKTRNFHGTRGPSHPFEAKAPNRQAFASMTPAE